MRWRICSRMGLATVRSRSPANSRPSTQAANSSRVRAAASPDVQPADPDVQRLGPQAVAPAGGALALDHHASRGRCGSSRTWSRGGAAPARAPGRSSRAGRRSSGDGPCRAAAVSRSKPSKRARRAVASSSAKGCTRLKPRASARASICTYSQLVSLPLRNSIGPSAMLRVSSGTRAAGSMVRSVPRPLQCVAGAGGRVEGEQARLGRTEAAAAAGAGRLAAVDGAATPRVHDHRAAAQFGGAIQGGLEAVAQPGAADHAVDHDGDVVAGALGQVDLVVQLVQLAVDQHAHVALGPQIVQQLPVLALAPDHHRRQQVEARALGHGGDLVLDLGQRAAAGRDAAVGAVDGAAAGEEQTQEAGDLGHRADGRARAAAQALLVDGQGRREAVDAVHVRLGQLVQELVGVAGEALDVAALAFGIQGVEGQRRLARTAGAGHHHQAAPGQPQVQVLAGCGRGRP